MYALRVKVFVNNLTAKVKATKPGYAQVVKKVCAVYLLALRKRMGLSLYFLSPSFRVDSSKLGHLFVVDVYKSTKVGPEKNTVDKGGRRSSRIKAYANICPGVRPGFSISRTSMRTKNGERRQRMCPYYALRCTTETESGGCLAGFTFLVGCATLSGPLTSVIFQYLIPRRA